MSESEWLGEEVLGHVQRNLGEVVKDATTDEHATDVWEKACACKYATASGPRLVREETFSEQGGFWITQTMHRMVCDECDTPWTLRAEIGG